MVPGALARHTSGVSAERTDARLWSGCIAEYYFESRHYYLTKHFGSIPMLNRLVLRSPAGDVEAEVEPVVRPDAGGDEAVTVGETGRAVCELRPSGQMEIAGKLVDVVSNGTWVPAGRTVRIVEVHGNRVVVEEA